jgi:thiol-disulfide isomerase/thioredoxin
MKNRLPLFTAAVFSLIVTASIWVCSANPLTPQAGNLLPAFDLSAPADAREQAYLGLDGKKRFHVDQIQAKFVIIEIFSMYCPYCQKDAPVVNELYQLIDGNAHLKDQIKLIGIGAGNSPFEVAFFKKKYQIEFPLFADADFKIHKLLGEVRTPFFIVVAIEGKKGGKIVFAQLGNINSAEPFLEKLLKLTGLAQ